MDVLERLLAVAEFSTSAVHGERATNWEAGVLITREAPTGETFGFNAWGSMTAWSDAPEGAQVTWCEQGGALLVDGLAVEPEVARGVLSSRGLSGVVVNLTGRLSPGKLSVDRRRIISDLSETVRELLQSAVVEFVDRDSAVLSMEWIHQVTEENCHLADLVAAEVIRQGRGFEFLGVEYETRRTGCFLADAGILRWFETLDDFGSGTVLGNVPDHILLWRMLAHGVDRSFPELGVLCPELPAARAVLPAMPSDIAVLAPRHREFGRRMWALLYLDEGSISDVARNLGVAPESVRARAVELGVFSRRGSILRQVPDHPSVTVSELLAMADRNGTSVEEAADALSGAGWELAPEIVDLAAAVDSDPVFLWTRSGKGARWAGPVPGGAVPPGHLVKAGRVLGIPVDRVCAAMANYGLEADPMGLSPFPSDETAALLSWELKDTGPWLERSEVVPPDHLLRAVRDLGITVERAAEVLGAAGFTVSCVPEDACLADLDLFQDGGPHWYNADDLTYERLLAVVASTSSSLAEVVERCRAYGMDVPFVLPESPTRLDEELFSDGGAMDWSDLRVGDPVPFARLIMAARRLQRDPGELARHLRSRGIVPSCDDLPAGVTSDQAFDLLDGSSSRPIGTPWIEDVTLLGLLKRSLRTGRRMAQITDWYREWGLEAPDAAELIREALARVPMADPS